MAVVDSTDTASTVNYVTVDALNTPRVVTNASGSVIWSWPIIGNPFGEQQPTSSTGYVYNLRFPGQYYDAENGLNYNLNRYLDTTIGRYTQNDPLGYGGGQWSWYGYVNGNPLNRIDPLGLKEFPAVIVDAGGGYGVVGISGGMMFVLDPANPAQIHTFGYGGGNVGLGLPGNAYGALQVAVVHANSLSDISGWGWYASGGLASPGGGVSGSYSGSFWFQDASYNIKGVGGAAGAAANVGIGISHTWALDSINVGSIPKAVYDALGEALRKTDGCK